VSSLLFKKRLSLCGAYISVFSLMFFSDWRLPRRRLVLLLFVLIQLVLIFLPVRAQLNFSGDVALQDTQEARPHASVRLDVALAVLKLQLRVYVWI